MKKVFNSYTAIFLALTAYLMLYRTLYRTGFPDFYASVAGCLVVLLVCKLGKGELAFDGTGKKMTFKVFIIVLGLLYLAQLLGRPIYWLFEKIFNLMGRTMYGGSDVVQEQVLFDDALAKLTTAFFPIILGPIIEELLYRSYGAKNFSLKGGMVLGIVVSAAAFAIGHGRFYLCIHTFFAGLVFGWLLFEYGFKWACIFHIINNLGIVGIDMLIFALFPEKVASTAATVFSLVMVVLAVLLCLPHRGEIAEVIRQNKAPEGEFKKAFLNPGFIVMVLYSLYKAVINVTPM